MSESSIDELFRLLEEEQRNKEDPKESLKKGYENKDVLRFIRKFKLAPGENKVPTYLIYHQYKIWQRTVWKAPWGKEEFFRTFKKYFEQRRTGNQRYYLLNEGLDLSKEAYEKAKKYEKGWQKRDKSKGKDSISSSEQGDES
jgi:hypothetical protein